jgi:hypothetical protein
MPSPPRLTGITGSPEAVTLMWNLTLRTEGHTSVELGHQEGGRIERSPSQSAQVKAVRAGKAAQGSESRRKPSRANMCHHEVAVMTAGPFEAEREASAASLWAQQGREQGMTQAAANLAGLAAALSGVELGSYDKRIIEWLAGWEPSTVAVICGLISRARALGAGNGRAERG